jgi:hypothetical protein
MATREEVKMSGAVLIHSHPHRNDDRKSLYTTAAAMFFGLLGVILFQAPGGVLGAALGAAAGYVLGLRRKPEA